MTELITRMISSGRRPAFQPASKISSLPRKPTASGKPPGQQQAMWFSAANEHFLDKSGVLGPLILFLGVDATETTNAESWIRSQYDGENTSSSSGAATSASEDATFFVGLQVKQRNP